MKLEGTYRRKIGLSSKAKYYVKGNGINGPFLNIKTFQRSFVQKSGSRLAYYSNLSSNYGITMKHSSALHQEETWM